MKAQEIVRELARYSRTSDPTQIKLIELIEKAKANLEEIERPWEPLMQSWQSRGEEGRGHNDE